MVGIGAAYSKIRVKLSAKADRILIDTCRLIVGDEEYEDVPCQFSGSSGNIDGAPYVIKLQWDSPAVIGAAVIVDEIPGRAPITLQLVEPVDSSTALWQEWRATSAPIFGRANVGL